MKRAHVDLLNRCMFGVTLGNTVLSMCIHQQRYETVVHAGVTLVIATFVWPRALWIAEVAVVCATAGMLWPTVHHEPWLAHGYARAWATVVGTLVLLGAALRWHTIRLAQRSKEQA